MMGNKGTVGGDEYEALSRRSRRLIHWKTDEVAKIKRKFWKRTRKLGKIDLRKEPATL